MQKFSELLEKATRFCDYLAGFCLTATMLLIVINILLRVIWRSPITGTIDYVNVLSALTIALALAYCAVKNGHIMIDLVVEKWPARAQALVDSLISLLSLIFWIVATWYTVEYGITMMNKGVLMSTASIPVYPVLYLIALGLSALSVVLLHRTIQNIRKVFA
ncbi:MAG: TRAP transporter small permease [Syntrophomonas sp.]